MSSTEYRLTTFDNPYDPFSDYDHWFLYDVEKGYNSSALLDRIANTSPDMSDNEYNEEIERAIDEIIRYDFMNLYKKAKKNSTS